MLITVLIGTSLMLIHLKNEKELARQDLEFRFENQCREEMVKMLIGYLVLLDENNHIKNLSITSGDRAIILSPSKLYKALKQAIIPFDTLTRWEANKSFVDSEFHQYHILIKGKRGEGKQLFFATEIVAWGDGVNKVNEHGKGDDILISFDVNKELIL